MLQKRNYNVNVTLIDTLSEITRIGSSGITYDTLIFEELGLDSLMAIEILAKIEKRFDIIIEESLLANINTVGDFIQAIEEKINMGN
ncbi:acyl carrier protein [Desulfotignum phosphitoxidans]|uniref:Long-chain-fatty-acid--CoA ligase LcfB n=1 Tax=Desulfotignum phosphitoxidans DSM 13687 TaxID=1286635 RepID=S0G738_9BACT|nr:acyl carrier protein [Desulfotignum phosphitoxidans]EMS80827.1 long-chain-fatty-acid--CoA ligase LcfB [Desulfotignum phosphitoxidans DSM 13687]